MVDSLGLCFLLSVISVNLGMAQAVAGAVLGPRPGKAICSFCQGRVEILLRIIAVVVSNC